MVGALLVALAVVGYAQTTLGLSLFVLLFALIYLDTGGNSTLSRLRRALAPRGTLVIVGGEGGGRLTGMGRQLRALALSPLVGQRLTTLGPKEHYTVLERLTELIEGGQLVPAIERTYPLDEMPDAMRHLEAGRARGKLVIAVSST